MKKRRKRFVLVSILVFLLAVVFYRILIFKQEERKRVLKVGFYDNYPYFYINDKAKVCGDYNEIVKSLSKRLNFKVEYVNCSLLELLKELENGEIDLVVGINKTPEREKFFEFSKNYINEKKYSIYTNENINYGNLEALNGKKMGYIKNELDNEKILNYLKSRNINVELVNGSSYKGIKTLLIDDKVDFIVDNSDSDIKNKGKDIKEIFQFSSGPKYIITNKNNKELINEIDQGLNSINVEKNKGNTLYNEYFNKFFNDNINKHILIIVALIVFLILLKKEEKQLEVIIKKNRIINDLKKDNYILYYQPIVDFKHNRVRSVEALLRLRKMANY
ncbi:transporter substrate-binding domain-containing protein [Clostridium perfringens]|nr:transporter substrate-binding domain-containing protein [Clostridium perfringens]